MNLDHFDLTTDTRTVTRHRVGHLLLMGLNRVPKRNAFDLDMREQLALAYGEMEQDKEIRCGVLYAHGDHFTGGLDLAQVSDALQGGGGGIPDGGVDWRGFFTAPRSKPVVCALQGWCLTLGIEIALATDVRVAAEDTRFSQMEVSRGIYPFGGATIRFPREVGWGNAMRWLLTGDRFNAQEALRLGLVQEVVEPGTQVERAAELAERIASRSAPLGVRAILASAQRATVEGERAAIARLDEDVIALLGTEDGAEGMASFVERRSARFVGR